MKSNKHTNIKVGNISNAHGEINIAGGDITNAKNNISLSTNDIKKLFDQLYVAIEMRADTHPVDRANLHAEVEEVQATVTQAVLKKDKVDENSLVRHFRNIARMAPDILDVAVTSLANPLAGLGVAIKKIAEKAKEGI